MPKANKRKTGTRAVFMFVLLGAMGAGALAYYVQSSPFAQRVPVSMRAEAKPTQGTHADPTTSHPAAVVKVHAEEGLRIPSLSEDRVSLVTAKDSLLEGEDPKEFVATHVLAAAGLPDVRCLGVQVKDNVALIEFTKELQDGVGSMQEGEFVKMLQVGFGQFPDVKKFQILIDGKPIDSLGHLDLSEPISVSVPGPVASEEGA